jgi:superfamily II DNA/RNA helicase
MSLDGHDVLATMATGAGKTGFFTFLMLVIRAISEDSSLAIGTHLFPEDPAMIVICPTKALQADMACTFSGLMHFKILICSFLRH